MPQLEALDPIEEELGVRVESMTPDQLVSYLKIFMREIHGLDLAVGGVRERAVFAGLQRDYGAARAGQIVKWACLRHRGLRGGKIPLCYIDFSKSRRWWTDQLDIEVQRNRRQARPLSVAKGVRELEI